MEAFLDDKSTLYRTKFFIFIILQIPSILITLFIFTFFIIHRTVLKHFQNQALLILLIINFMQLLIVIPMPIHFYYFGYIIPATAGYCTWWTFSAYSCATASEFLMATISIQRHILIFQPHILQVRFKRYIFYYLPLILSAAYPFVLYMIIIVFYPCDGTQWNFTASGCGYANCYLLYDQVLATFDWTVDNGLPIIVIFLANLTLVIRVIKQKYRRQRVVNWQNQRRMTLQLTSISSLYLLAWSPSIVIAVMQQFISATFAVQIQTDYTMDLIYLVCLLLPWLCLGLLPEFTKWIRKYLRCEGLTRNVVRPT